MVRIGAGAPRCPPAPSATAPAPAAPPAAIWARDRGHQAGSHRRGAVGGRPVPLARHPTAAGGGSGAAASPNELPVQPALAI